MAFKVLIPQDIAQEGKDYLTERGYEVIVGSGFTEEIIMKEVVDCDAMLVRTANYPAKVIEAGKKLKVISRHGVGYDNIDVAKCTELGIWVTFAPESNANTVAEYAAGCIPLLAKKFLISDRETRAGNWEMRNKIGGNDIEGKILGIVGMGKIGRRVAKKAAMGMDMKVIGFDPFLKPEQFPDFVTPAKSWDDLFATADFISIHIPGGGDRKGVIGKKEFGLMKPTAYIINAARGDIINEADLIEALQNKKIAGAALDVFTQEPPAKDNPLFKLDNVVVTPHNAALTKECSTRMALHAAQGIDEVLSKKTPSWPVNKIEKR